MWHNCCLIIYLSIIFIIKTLHVNIFLMLFLWGKTQLSRKEITYFSPTLSPSLSLHPRFQASPKVRNPYLIQQ